MKKIIHRLAGTLALLLISCFWLATILTELSGQEEAIYLAKRTILYAMALLIPSLMVTAGSGFALAGKRVGRLVNAKKKRMPFIAMNGLLILVPSAVFLWWKAAQGEFDLSFAVVQALELAAGATNITLLGLNMRDGIQLSRMTGTKPVKASRPA